MEARIYCMMWSGVPLTPQLSEALFVNALDMWQEGNCRQPIRTSKYDGVIESELEVIEYFGEPAISFEAMVTFDKWEGTQVQFVVHLDALKSAPQRFMGMISEKASLLPPPPPPMRPKSRYDPSMN